METKTLSLYHLIKQPSQPTEKTPVLFLLHGYGSDEKDLFSFAPELSPELCIISVRAPHPMQPFGNAWYSIYMDATNGKFSDDDEAIDSRELIIKFVDEAIQAYDLDPNNVSLLGFSQGAILSYAIALSYPQKIKNVVALSGYINDKIIKENALQLDHSQVNIYCSHGSMDQVIPVEWARKAPEFLQKFGIATKLNEFPMGHSVIPQNFYQFKEWLSERI